jgi:hypothetical protein
MHHSITCHPASCLRLLTYYLALFRGLKSVGAAPFPSSPAAGVADGNGFLFRDATFSQQRADALMRQFLAMESLWPPVTEVTGATPMVFFFTRGRPVGRLFAQFCIVTAPTLTCTAS